MDIEKTESLPVFSKTAKFKKVEPEVKKAEPEVKKVEPEVKKVEPQVIKLQAQNCNLLEPYENIWFKSGVTRDVYKLTKWMQGQIDAGLLKVL